MMPFTFADFNKDYRVVAIKGNEDAVTFLKKLGVVKGNIVQCISNNSSGFIIKIKESRFAIDAKMATKIMVEEV